MAAYWEIAAHSAYDIYVFLVRVPTCQFSFFSPSQILEWEFLSDCPIS